MGLLDYWPIILAAAGGLFGFIKSNQTNKLKAQIAEGNVQAESQARESEKAQYEASQEGNKVVEQILEEAHEENSAGDLTKSDY